MTGAVGTNNRQWLHRSATRTENVTGRVNPKKQRSPRDTGQGEPEERALENTHPVRGGGTKSTEAPRARRRPAGWKVVMKGALLVFLLLLGVALGAGSFVLGRFYRTNPLEAIVKGVNQYQAMERPEKFFPGKNRVNILCLGLDRNIVKSKDPKINGMPSTKDARSDVMMVVSVDFDNQTAAVLSVPRDTRVRLPRLDRWAKINEAHARGGIGYTIDTVSQFLGVNIDHHVVIKQEAIQKVIDELGGLKLKVAKDMDYDDNWGQLHVHLKEGEYTLNGEQVVGFMRFRHDAEGDFGRIKRQQQVIQQLTQRVSSPQILFKALGLIDVIDEYVRTDLRKDQQMALAFLVKKIGQPNITTLSLPVADTATINGVSYVIADEDKKEAAVDWIVRGNPEALNRLVTVEIKNQSGDPELYQRTAECLRRYGFNVSRAGRARGEALTNCRVVQRTNLRGAGKRVMEVLGVTGNVEKSDETGADVTLYVGQDLQASSVVSTPEMWPEAPERKITEIPRSAERRSRRRRRSAEAPVRVQVRPAEEEETASEAEPAPEPEMDFPGAPEPELRPSVATPESAPRSGPDPAPSSSGEGSSPRRSSPERSSPERGAPETSDME